MAGRRRWISETAKSVCDETGLSDPIDGVIKLAEGLTTTCSLTHPARNLTRLASFQGAKIEYVHMEDAGRLLPIPDGAFDFLIQANASDSQARQNFSVCHEIGHTLMPNFFGAPAPRNDRDVMVWDEEAEEEFLCDVAAAELLMPRREFVPRLRGCDMRIEALTELSQEFGSSLEATAMNIVRANIDDVAVLVWEKDWNKQQKQSAVMPSLFAEEDGFGPVPKSFRIKLASSCGQLREYHFPHNKSIGEDSLIYQAAETTLSVCGRQELPIGGGRFQEFFTQSMSFPIWRDGNLERRVFTLVHLREPRWD